MFLLQWTLYNSYTQRELKIVRVIECLRNRKLLYFCSFLDRWPILHDSMYSQSTLFGENLSLNQSGVHKKDWHLAWTQFRKNQHFRPITPKIIFVTKISPSKVGVIGVLINKGVKRHKKHRICT